MTRPPLLSLFFLILLCNSLSFNPVIVSDVTGAGEPRVAPPQRDGEKEGLELTPNACNLCNASFFACYHVRSNCSCTWDFYNCPVPQRISCFPLQERNRGQAVRICMEYEDCRWCRELGPPTPAPDPSLQPSYIIITPSPTPRPTPSSAPTPVPRPPPDSSGDSSFSGKLGSMSRTLRKVVEQVAAALLRDPMVSALGLTAALALLGVAFLGIARRWSTRFREQTDRLANVVAA